MSKRVLVCLVGLPAAGKSTLCSKLLNKPSQHHITHICYDKHIARVDHASCPNAWNAARQNMNQKISDILSNMRANTDLQNCTDQGTSNNKILLLDDNFFYRGMRKEILHLAQQNSCVFGQIVFRVSTELAISANRDRKNTIVTTETIKKMTSSIEYPSEAWEQHVLQLDEVQEYTPTTLTDRVERVEEFLDYLCEQDPEMDPAVEQAHREADRERSLRDAVQQCEVIMRRVISEQIKCDRAVGRKIPYSVYSDAKTAFLEEVKSGAINFEVKDLSVEAIRRQFLVHFENTTD